MSIKIHRGENQIGGCVTEIYTENARVFIDLGADLSKDKEKAFSEIKIPELTIGNPEKSVLLITHYHGDHIGRITQANEHIKIYMGETAKKINMVKTEKLAKYELIDPKEVEFLKKTITFKPKDKLKFGDITVIPYMIDHSAFDAYSFLIEANGKKIFYTGDFRLHGTRSGKDGKKMLKLYQTLKGKIDYLICEGTNILKTEKAQSEFELGKEAVELYFEKYKNIFILCSSTNIDRILTFYHAYKNWSKNKRPFICDNFQKKVLEIVKDGHGEISPFYKYDKIYDYCDRNEKLKNWMNDAGFCFLIRNNNWSKKILEKYFKPNESIIIYSMWNGYLYGNDNVKNEDLINFFKDYEFETLHTSGHADVDSIKKIVETIEPKHIMPLHTENREEFSNLFENVILDTEVKW